MAASSDEVVRAALSDQEKRVLRLAAQGKTNKQIAVDLFLSDKTVKHHISNILSKLNLSSRAQAAVWATQHGLLDEFRSARPAKRPATESSATHVLLTERLAPGIGRSAQRGADRRISGGAGAGYAPRYGPRCRRNQEDPML